MFSLRDEGELPPPPKFGHSFFRSSQKELFPLPVTEFHKLDSTLAIDVMRSNDHSI